MSAGRRKFFHHIGGTIQDLLAHLDTGGQFDLVRLMRIWPEIVGESIARRTEVTALKFHTAVIKVSSAMWIHELTFMRPQLLARLAAALGNDVVRELRFVSGRLSRRESPPLRPIARGIRRPIELPELKDHELQQAFDRLIEAWGRSSR